MVVGFWLQDGRMMDLGRVDTDVQYHPMIKDVGFGECGRERIHG